MHEVAPAVLEYLPNAHAVHGKDPFVLAHPSGHCDVHRDCALEPAVLQVREGHVVGEEEPRGQKEPAGQIVPLDEPAAQNAPEGQFVGELDPSGQ